MNKISCKFIEKGGLTDSCGNDHEVVIDNRQTGNYFNTPGFVLSAKQDGIFPMFAGYCGTLGCCGVYIEVKHEKDIVIWQKFWNGQCGGDPDPGDEIMEFKFTEDFIIKPPLVFSQGEYKKLANTLTEHVKKMPDRWRQFSETLERYESGDKFCA